MHLIHESEAYNPMNSNSSANPGTISPLLGSMSNLTLSPSASGSKSNGFKPYIKRPMSGSNNSGGGSSGRRYSYSESSSLPLGLTSRSLSNSPSSNALRSSDSSFPTSDLLPQPLNKTSSYLLPTTTDFRRQSNPLLQVISDMEEVKEVHV